MKNVILSIALGLALISCNRDNDNNEKSGKNLILPIKIEITEGSQKYIKEFKYDGDKLLEIIKKDKFGTIETKQVIEYNGDLIASIANYQSTYTGDKSIFTYDDNGRLIEEKIEYGKDRNGKPLTVETYTYTYNNDNTITQSYKEPYRSTSSQTITIENDNLVKSTNGYTTHTYTYDTKNNPFRNIKGLTKLNLRGLTIPDSVSKEVEILSKQNLLEHIYTIPNSETRTTTNEYVYNDKDFPIEQTQSIKVSGSSGILTTYYKITYNK